MTAELDNQPGQQGPSSKTPLIVTSLFGLLYLWFVIVSYIPAPDGTWVNSAVPYEPSRQAMIVYTLMFLLFLGRPRFREQFVKQRAPSSFRSQRDSGSPGTNVFASGCKTLRCIRRSPCGPQLSS